LSTSQSPTTAVGATCINLNKSLFPYHPVPIRATLLAGPSENDSNPDAWIEERANRAALFLRKFLLLLLCMLIQA
jgi:hypothetical protein